MVICLNYRHFKKLCLKITISTKSLMSIPFRSTLALNKNIWDTNLPHGREGGLTNKRPGSGHVIWGPMRGLKKDYIKRGHQINTQQTHKQTHISTTRPTRPILENPQFPLVHASAACPVMRITGDPPPDTVWHGERPILSGPSVISYCFVFVPVSIMFYSMNKFTQYYIWKYTISLQNYVSLYFDNRLVLNQSCQGCDIQSPYVTDTMIGGNAFK